MRVVLEVVLMVLDIYWWIVLATIVFSWLIAFSVINTRNQFVNSVTRVLNQVTEPVLRPIRRYMPKISGLDIAPIILFLIIFLIQRVIIVYIYPNVF